MTKYRLIKYHVSTGARAGTIVEESSRRDNSISVQFYMGITLWTVSFPLDSMDEYLELCKE